MNISKDQEKLFVGRESEFNQLQQLFEQALAGTFQVAFVTGEAGIGKTTVVEAFMAQCAAEHPDLFVASSLCSTIAGGQQEPYLPFIQILDTLADEEKNSGNAWDRLRRMAAELAPEWIQIIPVGGDLVAASIKTAQVVNEQFREQGEGVDLQRRIIQYANLLKRVAEETPLILLIDDLHWADNATLEMISFLPNYLADSPIMLISTYRSNEVRHKVNGQPHPVRKLVDKLRRNQQCTKIPVARFTLDNVKQFFTLYDLTDKFLETLFKQSGGNPLFIREYRNLLHQRDLLHEQDGRYVLNQPDASVDIPETVKAVIEQRLELLPEDSQKLLQYASVQGERFDTRLLAKIVEKSEFAILDICQQITEKHALIFPRADAVMGNIYQFQHGVFQTTLYEQLHPGQCRILHLHIAQHLEQIHKDKTVQYAVELARHYESGQNHEKAIEYHLQAGQNAMSVLALENVVAHANSVQSLAKNLTQNLNIKSAYLSASLQLAESYFWQAEYTIAIQIIEESELLCDTPELTKQHAELLYWKSRNLYRAEERGSAIDVVREAIKLLGEQSNSPILLGKLLVLLASFYYQLKEDEITWALTTASEIAEKHDLIDLQIRILTESAWINMNIFDDPEQSLECGEQALLLTEKNQRPTHELVSMHRVIAYASRRLGMHYKDSLHTKKAVEVAKLGGIPRGLHVSMSSLACTQRSIDEWRNSKQWFDKSIQVAYNHHFPPQLATIYQNIDVTIGLGFWEDASRLIELYGNTIDDSYPRGRASYTQQSAHLLYAQGKLNEAHKVYKRSFDIMQKHDPSQRGVHTILSYFGGLLIGTGNATSAKETLEKSYSFWKNRKSNTAFVRTLYHLGRLELIQGNVEEGIVFLKQGLSLQEGKDCDGWQHLWSNVSFALAESYLIVNDYRSAKEHSQFAYQKLKQIGHCEFGEAAFIYGKVLLTMGEREKAITPLHEAWVDWERLQLAHHLPKWDAIIHKHSLPHPNKIDR